MNNVIDPAASAQTILHVKGCDKCLTLRFQKAELRKLLFYGPEYNISISKYFYANSETLLARSCFASQVAVVS